MKGVAIAGIGMTQFGKQVGRGLRSLALAAIEEAIADSGLASDRIDRIYFGNAISGIISQQEMVRGQVALRHQVLGKVPCSTSKMPVLPADRHSALRVKRWQAAQSKSHLWWARNR